MRPRSHSWEVAESLSQLQTGADWSQTLCVLTRQQEGWEEGSGVPGRQSNSWVQ